MIYEKIDAFIGNVSERLYKVLTWVTVIFCAALALMAAVMVITLALIRLITFILF